MRLHLFVALFLFPFFLHAELPPSAYEAMQSKAPEYLKIEVLRVEIEPADSPVKQKVQLMALVTGVERSASGVKEGDFINIGYVVTEHPQGWAGPGEIPFLNEKDQTVAYLTKDPETGTFSPAAGRMSFSNF